MSRRAPSPDADWQTMPLRRPTDQLSRGLAAQQANATTCTTQEQRLPYCPGLSARKHETCPLKLRWEPPHHNVSNSECCARACAGHCCRCRLLSHTPFLFRHRGEPMTWARHACCCFCNKLNVLTSLPGRLPALVNATIVLLTITTTQQQDARQAPGRGSIWLQLQAHKGVSSGAACRRAARADGLRSNCSHG